jgi:(p)ppGpp synthase/HD superfamily hydrolase
MLTERISQALALAVQAHKGQFRKGTSIPYVSHPMAVASIALEFGADEDQAIAALLHDVLEDGGPHFEDIIKEGFGARVLGIVLGCTDGVPDADGKKLDWDERKSAYLKHLETASDDVILVSGSDKLHNARAILSDYQTIGLGVFDRFTTGHDGTLWYYQNLAQLFLSRKAPMASALQAAVSQFPKVKERMCGTFVLRQAIDALPESERAQFENDF